MRFLPLLILAASGTAGAETFGVGPHAGVSLVRISSDHAVDTEFAPKPVFGVHGELRPLDELSVRLAIEYAGKGGKVTTTTPGSPTVEYSLGYLELPAAVRYRLGAGDAEAYVFGGATLAILLSATQSSGGTDTDVKSALAAAAVSLDVGAGIGYRIHDRITASVDISYSFGLNQIAGTAAVLDVTEWKVSSVQIVGNLTYTFGKVAPRASSRFPSS